MKKKFIVTIEVPDETVVDGIVDKATASLIRSYVKAALESWGGQSHPDAVMFSPKVSVNYVPKSLQKYV